MQQAELPNSEAAILARVIQAVQDDLSPAAARALLKFAFTPRDRDRMHELAVKNQDGAVDSDVADVAARHDDYLGQVLYRELQGDGHE